MEFYKIKRVQTLYYYEQEDLLIIVMQQLKISNPYFQPLGTYLPPPLWISRCLDICLSPVHGFVFFSCSNERNIIEAAAKGASTAISLVANIAANLIAFLAFLSFFNGVLSWIGSMVGHPEFSFEVHTLRCTRVLLLFQF